MLSQRRTPHSITQRSLIPTSAPPSCPPSCLSQNVVLDRGTYIKLVDFGLAKAMNLSDPLARTWTLCGKAEYVAPEIIQSKGHSKEVDWWALGIVIHEMLAGYPPWYDKDSFKIYQKGTLSMSMPMPM